MTAYVVIVAWIPPDLLGFPSEGIDTNSTPQMRDGIVTQTHPLGKWNRSIAIVLVLTVMGLVIAPGLISAEDQVSGTDSSDGMGIRVASWALTVPYCVAKTAFAIGGGFVGGLGYFFSGGNLHTAQAIWTTSVTGTYIIRPAHLRGEEPIRFFGHADDSQATPVPHPSEPAPATSGSPNNK